MRSVRRRAVPVEYGADCVYCVYPGNVQSNGRGFCVCALLARMGGQLHECYGVYSVCRGKVAESIRSGDVCDVCKGQVPVEDKRQRLPGL